MAQLVIKGHPTRGKEVIEILEMLGGRNQAQLKGIDNNLGYYIYTDGYINTVIAVPSESYKFFTIEGFLKKYPYKIGDKVLREPYVGARRICEMRWDTDNNCIKYGIGVGEWFNVSQIQPYKEENMDRKYDVEEYLKVWKETEKGLEVVVNDRFELKEDNGKFYIIKKQPQYPKTYEECCEVLDWNPMNYDRTGYKFDLLCKLQVLLICRDAYWKIAGEQMGLGKPWKPDFLNPTKEIRYFIFCTGFTIEKAQGMFSTNRILIFPTEEMRDEFYKNFRELIEFIKELL